MVIDEYIDFNKQTGISTDIKNIDGKVLDEIEVYGTTYNFAEEKSTKQVSSEYTQVEYIQGNENQYISSGIIPNDTTEIESNVNLTINSSGNIYFISNEQVEYIKVYNNSVLVRDLIPCYRKEDGLIGFYDLIELGFHTNMGSGTFIKGLDSQNLCKNAVNEPIIDMQISGNSVQGNLPSEYQQVEYISNRATATPNVIFNDILMSDIANSKIEVKMDCSFAYNGTAARQFFGAGNTAAPSGFGLRFNENNKLGVRRRTDSTNWQNTSIYSTTTISLNTKYNVNAIWENPTVKGMKLYINDVLEAEDTTTYGNLDFQLASGSMLTLFNSYSPGYTNQGVKVYYIEIYIDDVLRVKGYPCYRKSDNVAGIYNVVNGNFYINSLTGTLEIGGETPSPDAPIEIQSVGDYDEVMSKYKVPIKISGMNLYNESSKTVTNTYYNTFGEVTTHTSYTAFENVRVNVEPNTEYTLYWVLDRANAPTNIHNGCRMVFFDNDNAFINRTTIDTELLSTNTYTFTTPSNASYILFQNDDETTLYGQHFTEFMIAQGDTVNEYSPYIEPTTINLYLNEPLRKVGDYADYIDYKNKKVVRYVEVLDDSGTQSIENSYRGLEVPIEETIELPEIYTQNGTNIFEIQTTIQPSDMYLEYWKQIFGENKII